MVQEIAEIGLHFYFAQKPPVFENKCLANTLAPRPNGIRGYIYETGLRWLELSRRRATS